MSAEKDLFSVLDWIYDHRQVAEDFERRFPQLAADFKSGAIRGDRGDLKNVDAVSVEGKVRLESGIVYYVPTASGHFEVIAGGDSNYPGVDVEYIANGETEVVGTRPRVVFEQPTESGELRAMAWSDPTSEDYVTKIDFVNPSQMMRLGM